MCRHVRGGYGPAGEAIRLLRIDDDPDSGIGLAGGSGEAHGDSSRVVDDNSCHLGTLNQSVLRETRYVN